MSKSTGDSLLRAVPKPRILILEKKTGRVIHAVKITGNKSPAQIRRVVDGIERNLDTARYSTKEDL